MAKKENILVEISKGMAGAVEKAGAATVTVEARRRQSASGVGYADDLVLTANHVVERDEDITVTLPDGTVLSAEVAGRDPGSDLALLRVSEGGVPVAAPAGEEASVGQIALALGRPSRNGVEASLGVISAVGGPVHTHGGGVLERHFRTDAIPYPGFSGGPLVDAEGAVIGINTSGLAHGNLVTIPAKQAWQIAADLAEHGSIRRGYLGIRSQVVEIPEESQKALGRDQGYGLLLVGLEEDGPAVEEGLMVGDILVAIAGNPVSDSDELLGYLTGEVVGKPTEVEILRGGKPQTVTVTVGEREMDEHQNMRRHARGFVHGFSRGHHRSKRRRRRRKHR